MVVVPSRHLRGGTLIDATDLDVALRATFWPALKAHGFSTRTTRVAWRYLGDHIDVVELQTVGQDAEAIGCTPYSLSVFYLRQDIVDYLGLSGTHQITE